MFFEALFKRSLSIVLVWKFIVRQICVVPRDRYLCTHTSHQARIYFLTGPCHLSSAVPLAEMMKTSSSKKRKVDDKSQAVPEASPKKVKPPPPPAESEHGASTEASPTVEPQSVMETQDPHTKSFQDLGSYPLQLFDGV